MLAELRSGGVFKDDPVSWAEFKQFLDKRARQKGVRKRHESMFEILVDPTLLDGLICDFFREKQFSVGLMGQI